MNFRPWQLNEADPRRVRALQSALGAPELVCAVLAARGMDEAAARAFLQDAGQPLSDPILLSGMEAAVARIHKAVDEGERIVVFGDYDTDGVTATALLYTYLDAAGADVYYKLPNRGEDGYGLSEAAVELMAAKGADLIVTVDNGISAAPAVARARQLGVDVVVTDHHLPPPDLPAAAAVVDPQLPGDKSPCKNLSGAGVAFKLITALDGCAPEEMLPFYGDLAAIGTVADLMDLTGENRTLVRAGLARLRRTDRPGLEALIRRCGLEGRALTAENVSFGLAPRLNAAGRMDDAGAALRLLLCEDEEEAEALAAALDGQNAARQQTEQEIARAVEAAVEADEGYRRDRVLVVWGSGWHQGVIGIVASRAVERWGKPAIIVSVDENGEGRGSGRSVDGLPLYDALAACSGLLTRFGGHAMAAGLSLPAENLPALRKAVNEWAAAHAPVMHRPPLAVDAAVQLGTLTPQAVAALDALAPFGAGNPAPLFLVRDAVIEGVYPAGAEGRHSRLRLRQGAGGLYAALFGTPPGRLAYGAGDKVDAVLSLSVYEGRSGPMVSARVRDLRPAGMSEGELADTGLADALCCGAQLPGEVRERLRPSREDTARLYRLLAARGAGGVPADDLRPLLHRLQDVGAGKVLVALTALEQLDLVQRAPADSGAEVWRVVPVQGKKDLSSAPILRGL